jgi:lipoic acid synthetase
MVGVGETDEEILRLFEDLLSAGCMLLTIGQYLQPNRACIPVHDYVHPDHFKRLREQALSMGFRGVASGVFVRSSYNAREMYENVL